MAGTPILTHDGAADAAISRVLNSIVPIAASLARRGTARRSTVSIAAVLVSFGLMVAMAIMVYSFRVSLDDWMQRILPADVYVRAGSAGLSSYLDADAQAIVAAVPGVARADFVRFQDIVLPGEMKTILAQVVEAEKAAQANVIRRREETAATRSLLNTAKVMEGNPIALRMKELETLERVAERIDKISVFGGLDQVLHGLVKLR